MDEVTQQNAALVEEAAAAAISLEHQTDTLVKALSIFKLSVNESSAHTNKTNKTNRVPAVVKQNKKPAYKQLNWYPCFI